MPQNNYVEDSIKNNGRQLNYETKIAKKQQRLINKKHLLAHKLHGLRAKQFAKKNRLEKINQKKEVAKKHKKTVVSSAQSKEALPHFLLDRNVNLQTKETTKSVSIDLKKKSQKYVVPIPRVQGISEKEAFKAITTGKKRSCQWKRMVTKAVFVGDNFTRTNPKYERFIRPMALRFKDANVTNPQTQTTHKLEILGVKQNPSSELFTNLGILSKGTIIEVNVSELGLVSTNGQIIWGKFAQITNNPENDGCVNSVLLI